MKTCEKCNEPLKYSENTEELSITKGWLCEWINERRELPTQISPDDLKGYWYCGRHPDHCFLDIEHN